MVLASRSAILVGVFPMLLACGELSPQVGAQRMSSCLPEASAASSGYYGSGSAPVANCDGGGVGYNLTTDAAGTQEVLIADQLNNRVIVVDRQGAIKWWFGDGSSVVGPTSVVGPNDAEYLPSNEVLMVGTGTQPWAKGCTTGCDDRVLIVGFDATKSVHWTYGGHGSDHGAGTILSPASARLVATSSGDHVLVSNQGKGQVVEVDRASYAVTWTYPVTAGQATISPQAAERLANGDTLITDQGGNRVLEVNSQGDTVWQYPEIVNVAALNFPAFASRLPNGDTLIADSNNDRVIVVDQAKPGNIVWSYLVSVPGAAPTGAVRLADGDTLITLLNLSEVVEVDAKGKHVYQHGQASGVGSGANELNQPYNAKVKGDYTGLSSPR